MSQLRIKHWLIAALVLGALAFVAIVGTPQSDWECSPVDPLAPEPADPLCFRATLSQENLVTLEWRVANSGPVVYIYDDFGPNYEDVGFKAAVCHQGTVDGCSTSFRVSSGGFYRWQLIVENPRGNRTHAPASITVAAPYPLREIVGGGFVDMLAPTNRSISWFPDSRNDSADKDIDSAWIELQHFPSIGSTKRYPRVGSGAGFTVPASTFNAPGQFRYSLRDCHLPRYSDTKFCSPEKSFGFFVGSDRFLGYTPIQPASGRDLEISFTTDSGSVRLLSSPTLIGPNGGWPIVVTTKDSYLIDGNLLTPGLHKIELASCNWKTNTCSNRQDAERAEKAGSVKHKPVGYYRKGELIAKLTPEDGSQSQAIYAPVDGEVHFENAARVHKVEAGELIAYSITRNSDVLHIQVDSHMDWTVRRQYTDDFYPGTAYQVIGGGQPLDVTYGPDGGIWLLNEFSNSIEHVTADRQVETIDIPLARNPLSQPNAFAAVQPFLLSIYKFRRFPRIHLRPGRTCHQNRIETMVHTGRCTFETSGD